MAASNSRRLVAFLLIAFFANGTLSCAQQRPPEQELEPVALESATTALLQQMTRSAGVIFAGEVISVRRPAGYAGSGQDAAEGVVLIEFRVEEAVRGCVGGSTYTLREWAGLWTGNDRYRAGQRLLLFLHSPNESGLSSPVHGTEGTIPLRGGGTAPGRYDASAIAADWLVDLRWVQAQAPRAAKEMEHPLGSPAPTLTRSTQAMPLTRSGTLNQTFFAKDAGEPALVPVHPEPSHWTAPAPAAIGRSTQPLAQVLSLCREWVSALLSSDQTSDQTSHRTRPDGRQ